MASPESPPDAANVVNAGLNGKPSCGAVGKVFLQTFVSSWIAAKSDRDRAQRVRIIKTIMEQVQAEVQVNGRWHTTGPRET